MESYIHFTYINYEKLCSIFQYGILNKKNLIKLGFIDKTSHGSDFNGRYFISLTKKSDVYKPKSIYHTFSRIENYVGIEVKNINNIYKAECNNPLIFTNTIIPIRNSPYIDEWQTKDTILPENFISLIYNYDFFMNHKTDKSQAILNLLLLKKFIEDNNLNIPIIDKTTEKIL